MAKVDVEQEILRLVGGSFPQSAERLRGQVEALANLTAVQNDRVRENTDAVAQNTTSRGSGASQVANTSRSILNAIGGGLFLSPLINGIARLFRGSRQEEAINDPPAVRPKPVAVEAASFGDGKSGYSSFDFDQYGQPRRVATASLDMGALRIGSEEVSGTGSLTGSYLAEAAKSTPKSLYAPDRDQASDLVGETRSGNGVPHVTIQIQALDSRSILDRSDDIARALREAMLNSHAVNNVIGEV